MKSFTMFDEATGRALRFQGMPTASPDPVPAAGEVLFVGTHRDQWYNSSTQLLEPTTAMSPVATATEFPIGGTFDVTGLPLDSVCNVDGADTPLPDGIINATFSTVGIYQFKVAHPHHYPEEWTVEVAVV